MSKIENWIIKIAGFVIITLLGVLGFFLANLVESTEALTDTTNQLNITFQKTRAESDGEMKIFDMRLTAVEAEQKCIKIDIKAIKEKLK